MDVFVVAGGLAGASLLGISALHLYWLFGGAFPARSRAELGATVVGTQVGTPMPSHGATGLISLAFAGAALVPFSLSRLVRLPISLELVRPAGVALAGVFAVRGLYGFLDRRFRPSTQGTPFERLNLRVYSPLCLVISALVAATYLGAR